jgi:hypothetical protein
MSFIWLDIHTVLGHRRDQQVHDHVGCLVGGGRGRAMVRHLDAAAGHHRIGKQTAKLRGAQVHHLTHPLGQLLLARSSGIGFGDVGVDGRALVLVQQPQALHVDPGRNLGRADGAALALFRSLGVLVAEQPVQQLGLG